MSVRERVKPQERFPNVIPLHRHTEITENTESAFEAHFNPDTASLTGCIYPVRQKKTSLNLVVSIIIHTFAAEMSQ